MKCKVAWLAAFPALILSAMAFGQGDLTIQMSLDRSTIGMGESALLSLSVSGNTQNLPEPNLPPLPQFEIFSSGNSTSIQVINGVVSSSMTYNYMLFPKKEGTFPIRAASMVVNGKRYESNELTITVSAGGAGSRPAEPSEEQSIDEKGGERDVFLTAEVDNKSAYVDEQVTLRIKFFRAIKILSTPEYDAPQTPDFWTQDIPPQKQYYQVVNGRSYLVTEVRTALFPTKPGILKIGVARVTVTVPDRSRQRTRDPFSLFDDVFSQGRQMSVQSQLLSVNVRTLPVEGKTSQFSGGVGSYQISAEVDKTEVQVNEAITLTVKITGQGNVKSIPEPTLPAMDGFRVEKASSDFKMTNQDEKLGGSKTYEYLLIPRIPGYQKVASIVLNYFDPDKGIYKTTSTEPIELMVNQGEAAAAADIPYNMVAGQTINLKETDIRFIKAENGHLSRRGHILLTSPLFLIFLALPLMAVLGGFIDIQRKHRLQSDVAYARRRRAASEAKRRLKMAEKHLKENNGSAFYGELSAAAFQFIADKFNISAQGLTSDGVRDLLTQKSTPTELLGETLDLIRQADFGRFAGKAGAENNMHALFEQAHRVIIGLGERL